MKGATPSLSERTSCTFHVRASLLMSSLLVVGYAHVNIALCSNQDWRTCVPVYADITSCNDCNTGNGNVLKDNVQVAVKCHLAQWAQLQ